MRARRMLATALCLALALAGCAQAKTSLPRRSVVDSPTSPSRSSPSRASASTTSAPERVGDVAGRRRAARQVRGLTHDLGAGGVSVAAYDLTSGATFHTGAHSGMTEGSIAKLDIAEVLLLHQQDTDDDLSEDRRELLTAMLEHSDNDAADDLWVAEGGRRAVAAANIRLGVRSTALGHGIYWGLSTTGASDQLTLLHNLVRPDGPLTSASRATVLHLLRHVEADQRWGVGVVADSDHFANKNGWLANLADDDRWLVNSLGVLRVRGHLVLMAVLTQHDESFEAGIDLVQEVARAAIGGLD